MQRWLPKEEWVPINPLLVCPTLYQSNSWTICCYNWDMLFMQWNTLQYFFFFDLFSIFIGLIILFHVSLYCTIIFSCYNLLCFASLVSFIWQISVKIVIWIFYSYVWDSCSNQRQENSFVFLPVRYFGILFVSTM